MSPLFLAGPTASGKSAVAVELALALGGEILSADSMQVYRGMDIGTAKPQAERLRVPHHLIDLVEVDEPFTAAHWLRAAESVEANLLNLGRRPIYCGGTGLYFQVRLEGLDPLPPPDPELRQLLEATPMPDLLRELERDDPATWERIDRRNPRRVIRALEILRLKSRLTQQASPLVSGFRLPEVRGEGGLREPIYVLRRSPEDLRRRMEARVDAMFAAGLVEETRRLLGQGLQGNRTALQAIGYRQVVEHLAGERDLPSTIALIKTRTWQYGRRQLTWFRHRRGVLWLDVPEGESPAETAGRILGGAARA